MKIQTNYFQVLSPHNDVTHLLFIGNIGNTDVKFEEPKPLSFRDILWTKY